MKKYTFTFAINQSASTTDFKKIEDLIVGLGGKIEKKDDWGKKFLSYAIKNEHEAKYQDWMLELDPAKVSEFRKKLALNDQILRHLIIALDSKE